MKLWVAGSERQIQVGKKMNYVTSHFNVNKRNVESALSSGRLLCISYYWDTFNIIKHKKTQRQHVMQIELEEWGILRNAIWLLVHCLTWRWGETSVNTVIETPQNHAQYKKTWDVSFSSNNSGRYFTTTA